MRTSDPRIRQTFNQISENLESANQSAQEGIYNFSHNYIEPCFAGVRGCLVSCTEPCWPRRDDQLRRRKRGRSRGRAELNFDFYDDWDYEEDMRGDSSLLGWGHDELERLLAGNSGGRGSSDQPRGKRRMSYGARKKGSILPNDERQDPTVIPSSSLLGFLERFPWRIGARGTRYRPSGADLQENPGGLKRNEMENEPLLEGSDDSDEGSANLGRKGAQESGGVGRARSATQSSRETNNSLSSRGDLFPSDDEEDAVPLDDEFALNIAPRFHNVGGDDEITKHRSASGTSTKTTASSRGSKSTGKGKGKGRKSSSQKGTPTLKTPRSPPSEAEMAEPISPITIEDLKREEERAQLEEEKEVERRRQVAQELAIRRGLNVNISHENDQTAADTPCDTLESDAAAPSSPQEHPANYPIPASPEPESHTPEPEHPSLPPDPGLPER